MKTFQMQCKVEIIRILRNRYFVFWSLVMPIIFYYIFTNLVNSDVPNKAEWQAHYLMSMTVFSVMGSSMMTLGIRMVQERSQGWSTFIRVTPLSDISGVRHRSWTCATIRGRCLAPLCSIVD